MAEETAGPLKFYVETFGCQMNERDSSTIEGLLSQAGMTSCQDPKKADVIVLNTCAVRESAENKVWSRLGRLHSYRKSDDPPVMVLAGCMAQLPGTIKRIRSRTPYVQVVTGPAHIHEIPQLVEKALAGMKNGESVRGFQPGAQNAPVKRQAKPRPLVATSPSRVGIKKERSTQVLPEGLPRGDTPGISAYVNIMYGCDNFCSYCIVPYVRGPQVSRSPEAVKGEVNDLCGKGYKEIVLLGQNVNAYGLDLPSNHKFGFEDLLIDLDKTETLARLRYFTSHPKDFTRGMVDAVKQGSKICEHFHLPLQSGSDRILRAMNRGYTREKYLRLVDYIREQVPDASLTTDIIVGFPGETDGDFQDTLGMIRRCLYDGAFTFIFSARQGTAAVRMENQIDPVVKSERLQELVRVQGDITRQANKAHVGSTMEILVEKGSTTGQEIKVETAQKAASQDAVAKGRTRTNKLVIAQGDASPGDLVKVRIQEAGTWYLRGKIVQ